VFSGKLELIRELRKHQASYEIRDKSGMSALHYAVDGGSTEVVEWMIKDGADPNDKELSNGVKKFTLICFRLFIIYYIVITICLIF
jgi:ankyrin repeat protein